MAARTIAPQLPHWRGTDTDTVILTGHARRLWGLSPGQRSNLHTTASINALGLRGPAPTQPRPPDQARLMVLGDSTFFGFGIPAGQHLLDRAAATLIEAGVALDAVNGGVPGYSTEQTLLLLDEVGWSLEPTLLIVGSFWSDSNWEPFADRDLLHSQRVARYNPLVHSAAFRLLLSLWRPGSGSSDRVVTWTKTSGWPTDGVRRVPLVEYAENLDRIVRTAAEKGAGAILVSPPAGADLTSDDAQPWAPYRQAQQAIADHHGLPLVDGRAVFRAAHAENGGDLTALFLDEVHPTRDGHARLGAALAETLLEAGWPDTPLHAREEPFDLTPVAAWDDWGDRAEAGKSGSPVVNLFDTTGIFSGTQGLVAPVADPNHWVVVGRIHTANSQGPIAIQARTPDGRVVGRAQLAEPTRFFLRISRQYETVEVVVEGPEGTATARVKEGDDDLSLVLR